MIKNKKIAFVCALHQSKTHRPNGFELFNDYLVSIYTSCKYPFKLFAFDNASEDKFEIENCPDNLVITRVENQYVGGCTYTWNEGIKMAIKEDYDAVIITSDDQIYDESVNNFVDTILKLIEKGSDLSIVCDQIGTPTYASDLGQVILDIIKSYKVNALDQASEIYHYANKGKCS